MLPQELVKQLLQHSQCSQRRLTRQLLQQSVQQEKTRQAADAVQPAQPVKTHEEKVQELREKVARNRAATGTLIKLLYSRLSTRLSSVLTSVLYNRLSTRLSKRADERADERDDLFGFINEDAKVEHEEHLRQARESRIAANCPSSNRCGNN